VRYECAHANYILVYMTAQYSQNNEPTEEELIARLNQGNLSQEEMDELLAQMKQKGMKGTIMEVSDFDSEEGKVAREYIDYHPKIPGIVKKDEVERMKRVLLDVDSTIEEKKRAIMILAHVGRVDILETLEEYAKNPDEELRLWINMALQECESFLKGDILDEPVMSIGRVSKVGRNEPCPCGSGKKFKKCCG